MKKLLLLLLCVPLLFSCGEEKEKENYYLLKEICDCDIQAFEKIIKREEADNMRNFVKAIQNLNNMDPNTKGDFSLSIDIIKQNMNIPLILIDESQDVLLDKNLHISDEILNNPKKKKEYILNEIEIMKQVGDSISIDGFNQKLYYKSSDVNNKIIESIDLINKACEKIKTK